MVNTKIRSIIFFAAKDGGALYSKNETRSWLWLRSWTPYCQRELTWSHLIVSDYLRPHGLQATRLLSPCNFPGKSTGLGCHFLLQGIFPIQGSNLSLLHSRERLYHLSHQGNCDNKRWCNDKDKEDQLPRTLSVVVRSKTFTLTWGIIVEGLHIEEHIDWLIDTLPWVHNK